MVEKVEEIANSVAHELNIFLGPSFVAEVPDYGWRDAYLRLKELFFHLERLGSINLSKKLRSLKYWPMNFLMWSLHLSPDTIQVLSKKSSITIRFSLP